MHLINVVIDVIEHSHYSISKQFNINWILLFSVNRLLYCVGVGERFNSSSSVIICNCDYNFLLITALK